ncbi:MAG: TetR/AcrR family transcriptional regulator [Hyphomonadaceae bacterium]
MKHAPLYDPPSGARAKIYQAAVRLFAETSGADIALSDLAEAACIARGTIYNNIKEPENLFGEVATALAMEMIARTEVAMRDFDDPIVRIATGLRLFVRRAHEEQDWGRFLVRFGLSHSALAAMMYGPPARDIERAIADGRFKTDKSKAASLINMLNGATLAAMNAVIRGDQTWRDAGSATAELFLRAGGLSPAEARRIANADLPPLPAAPSPKRKKS